MIMKLWEIPLLKSLWNNQKWATIKIIQPIKEGNHLLGQDLLLYGFSLEVTPQSTYQGRLDPEQEVAVYRLGVSENSQREGNLSGEILETNGAHQNLHIILPVFD